MSEFTEANKEHFNAQADEYDSKPWMRTISQQVGTALQDRKDWIHAEQRRFWHRPGEAGGREVKLLDYACGTGSMTKALGPWVTRIIGMDISERMVDRYNDEAQQAGLKPDEVSAVVGDLLAEEVPEHLKTPEYYNFDLVAVGLGFHHFENPVLAIQRLSERLKPDTGVLLIVDFLPFEDDEERTAHATIKNRGFTRTNLMKLHELAGMKKFSYSAIDDPAVLELQEGTVKRELFMTRARKAPTAWGKFANWVYDMQVAASEQIEIVPKHKVPVKLGPTGQTVTNTEMTSSDWSTAMAKLGGRVQ